MILCTEAECNLCNAPRSKAMLLNKGNKSLNVLHPFFILESSHCNITIWLLLCHQDIKTPQLQEIDGSNRTKSSGTKSIKINIFDKISDLAMLHFS